MILAQVVLPKSEHVDRFYFSGCDKCGGNLVQELGSGCLVRRCALCIWPAALTGHEQRQVAFVCFDRKRRKGELRLSCYCRLFANILSYACHEHEYAAETYSRNDALLSAL